MPIPLTTRLPRVTAALGLAVGALLIPAGCSTSSPASCAGIDPTAINSLAVIQGNRAGTQVIATDEILCLLNTKPTSAAHAIVVIPDGSGHLVPFDARWVPNPNQPRTEKNNLDTFVIGFEKALTEKAVEPESNPLEAIALASQSLRDDPGAKLLVINDNLLQTTGLLEFQRGYLYAEPEEIAAQVRPQMDAAGVDLEGVRVLLMATGTSSGRQPGLDSAQRSRLVAIWSAILTDRGGTVGQYSGRQFKDVEGPLPAVTPVPLKAVTPITVETACTAVLTQDRVGFKPGSTSFLDPDAARQVIAAVAASLASCPGVVTVTGTTASGIGPLGREGDPYRAKLSLGRAQAVRKLLASAMNTPQKSIQVRGVGIHSKYYVPDRLPDGTLDPVKAQANRLVVVTVA